MGRKFFVGANWKCYGTLTSVDDLTQTVYSKLNWDKSLGEVIVAPSMLYLLRVSAQLPTHLSVAAQNCGVQGLGAYTGEVAAEQLRDAKVNWVILGHSERRLLYGDTDAVVTAKLKRLQELEMNCILCVGESLAERESDLSLDVVVKQLITAAKSISHWDKVVVAYEPVWAIGTGKVATPAQAQAVHSGIRKWVQDKAGQEVAASLRIIYGGSVTPENCTELITQSDIDGFLVGGAALKPGFASIVHQCEEEHKRQSD